MKSLATLSSMTVMLTLTTAAALAADGVFAPTVPVPVIPSAGMHATAPRPQGYLGIEFHDLSDEQVAAMHLRVNRGVEVVMVDHDGPAGKAGLRPHDIIVSLNGRLIASAESLRHLIHEAGAGASVAIAILREGRTVSVTTQLADRTVVEKQAWAQMTVPDRPATIDEEPLPSGPTELPASNSPIHGQSFIGSMLHTAPFTGLTLEPLTPQLAGFFGSSAGMGLLIQEVLAGSPASAAGLRAGDVVVRADGASLKSESDWSKRVRLSKGAPMTLLLMRDKRELTVTLLPDVKRHSLLEWPKLF